MGMVHFPPWMRLVSVNFGGKPYYQSLQLPNPIPYRGVVIAQSTYSPLNIQVSMVAPGGGVGSSVSQTDIYRTITPVPGYGPGYDVHIGTILNYDVICLADGVEIGRISGSTTGISASGSTPMQWLDSPVSIFTNWVGPTPFYAPVGMEYPVFNGGITYTPVPGTNNPIIYSGVWYYTWSAPFDSIIAAAQAAKLAAVGPKNLVLATDGQTLASESAVVPGFPPVGGDPDPIYTPVTTFWDGGGTLGISIQSNFMSKDYDHTLNFTVPEDCIVPINITPSQYPGVIVAISYTGVFVPSGGDQVAAPYSAGVTTTTATIHGPNGSTTITGTATVSSSGWSLNPGGGVIHGPVASSGGYLAISIYQNYPIGGEIWNGSVGYPTGDQIIRTSIYTTSQYQSVLGEYAAAVTTWNLEWITAQAALQLRRKKWFKKNSDTTIPNIKAGVLPISWSNFLKRNAPQSQHTYRAIPIAIDCNDVLVSDTTNNLAVDTAGVRVIQRTAVLKYTLPNKSRAEANAILVGLKPTLTMVSRPTGDPDTFDVDLSQTIVGTLTSVQTAHLDTNGSVGITDVKHTYANWHMDYQHVMGWGAVGLDQSVIGIGLPSNAGIPSIKGIPSNIDSVVLHPTLRDNSPNYYDVQTMLVCNGVIQDGWKPDTTTGSLDFRSITCVSYSDLTPPYPRESINLTETFPDIVVQYRKDVGVTYSEIPADVTKYLSQDAWPPPPATVGTGADLYREFSDSSPIGGGFIAFTLFGPVKSGESLGMFSDVDISTVTQTEVFGTATFQYRYDDGAFLFMGWHDAVEHYQVVGASVKAAGTGGTPGHMTVTGTTGTGTKFQADVIIKDGGGIESVEAITVPGDYTINPANVTAEPVTGGTGAVLTGAILNLTMKVLNVTSFDPDTGKYLGSKIIDQVSIKGDNDDGTNALFNFVTLKYPDVIALGKAKTTPTTYADAYAKAISDLATQITIAIQQAQTAGNAEAVAAYQALQSNAGALASFAASMATQSVAKSVANSYTSFENAVIPLVKVSLPNSVTESGTATDILNAQVVH